jgi:hypothetical protein
MEYGGQEADIMVIARNSNLLGKITVLIMVSLCVNTALALDGSGTQEDPWRIKSLDDFNDFAADANYWDDYTRLETDVNLAGRVYERAVIAWDVNDYESGFQGATFTGVFDGNDHKVIGLTIDDEGAGNSYLGLLGYINEGEVRNLGLEEGSVNGSRDDDGSRDVGGLVGYNRNHSDGSISDCYFVGSVCGDSHVGGLVGTNSGRIYTSYSTGDVNGAYCVGGLVGFHRGSIVRCYSIADVTGTVGVAGGLVGEHYYAQLFRSYSTGDVKGGAVVGGLLGRNQGGYGYVNDCFWDTETSGVDYGQWGTGKTTAEMKQQSTFTDWNFIRFWNIGENQTYPYLRVYLAGDINKDGIVNFLDIAITANQWMEEQ